ncbi:MAG: dihydrolipoamide acetyltransferase family protein [Pirellulaceae bacterium]
MAVVFKLPDLGENIESAQVVSIVATVGDYIEAEQTLIEVETDKAVTDVPAPVAGKLLEISVAVGDKLSVGDVIAKIEEGASESPADERAEPADKRAEAADERAEPADERAEPADERAEPADERATPADESAEPAEAADRSTEPADDGQPSPRATAAPAPAAGSTAPQQVEVPVAENDRPVPASPSVRKFAREIGVDISQVSGSGPAGRISVEDVKAFNRRTPTGGPRGAARKALPDFLKWGEIDRQPMSNVRKKTALQMESGWQAPHVTLHDKADVTALEQFRQHHKAHVEQAGGKLTITAMLLRIVSAALRKFPALNCSIDMSQQEVVYKKYVNVGVAADTPRGLVVPVILHADQKTVTQLSVELTEMAARARAGKLSLEEMTGGTFTLTNLGGIGIGHFTPIINDPEVAILGIGRSNVEPVHVDGQFQPRLMMPLSLSFDHRIVDGADGARFLRWIVEAIQQPLLLAMEG